MLFNGILIKIKKLLLTISLLNIGTICGMGGLEKIIVENAKKLEITLAGPSCETASETSPDTYFSVSQKNKMFCVTVYHNTCNPNSYVGWKKDDIKEQYNGDRFSSAKFEIPLKENKKASIVALLSNKENTKNSEKEWTFYPPSISKKSLCLVLDINNRKKSNLTFETTPNQKSLNNKELSAFRQLPLDYRNCLSSNVVRPLQDRMFDGLLNNYGKIGIITIILGLVWYKYLKNKK